MISRQCFDKHYRSGLLDEDDAMDRNNFRNIGRLAEVRFERSSFAFLDGLGRNWHQALAYFKRDALASQAAGD